MDVPIFPDLERLIVLALGPTAEAILLHQFCYWFSRPNMAGREWAYKTLKEWKDERGLGRRAVERGRDSLVKNGLIEWEHGPYKKVHYRINWPKLAQTLNLNPIVRPESATNGVGMPQTPETPRAFDECTPENGHKPHSYAGKPPKTGEQSRLYAPNAGNPAYLRGEPPKSGEHSNTEDYGKDYRTRDTSLQADATGFPSRAASEFNRGQEDQGDDLSPAPIGSADTDYAEVARLLSNPESNIGSLARRHLEGRIDLDPLLEAVSYEMGGGFFGGERHRTSVLRALEELAMKEAV